MKGKPMKYLQSLFALFVLVAAFPAAAVEDDDMWLDIETTGTDWTVKFNNDLRLEAYNQASELTLAIDIAQLLPESYKCLSAKKIRDIRFPITISKIVQQGDGNWTRAFSKATMTFSSRLGRKENKVDSANLLKNGLKRPLGTQLNVGTISFLAPFVCDDFIDSSMKLSGIRLGGRAVAPLEFKIVRGLPPEKPKLRLITEDGNTFSEE
jgi:hypothetical protein